VQTAETIAASGTAVATGIMGTLSALAAGTSVAGPIGAAIGGALALSMAIYKQFEGCGQTCTITSDIANQVEPILQKNVAQYLALPVHYASLQALYLNNFDTTWAALVQACSNPTYQAAGQRCVSDRQQGACHYHDSSGACWNWFSGYRDPIANDPNVVPDPSPVVAGGSAITSALGISPTSTIAGIPVGKLILPAAGALLLLWALDL
jgi:hypothetical protein